MQAQQQRDPDHSRYSVNQYAEDRALTLRNRSKLSANRNLLYWYRELYRTQFANFPDPSRLRVLEIGSGVSPLKRFYGNERAYQRCYGLGLS
jgi:hypothetical protein